MQLPPTSDFFNYANDPWEPIHAAVYGEWSPPGLVFNSGLKHIVYIPESNPFERPAILILKVPGISVKGGDVDIMMYAGNAGIPSEGYPWLNGNMVELTTLHIPDTGGHVVNRGKYVTGTALDKLMAMAAITNELRFGVASRSLPSTEVKWHSAQMMAAYR